MNLKKSKLKGKKSANLKRILLKQEPELYSNSIILAQLINICTINGKSTKSEAVFYHATKRYKLKYKLWIQKLLFELFEKIKPALIGKPINWRAIFGSDFTPYAPQRTNYIQKYKIAMRWFVEGIRKNVGNAFYLRFISELESLRKNTINVMHVYRKSTTLIEALAHPLNERFIRFRFTKKKRKKRLIKNLMTN